MGYRAHIRIVNEIEYGDSLGFDEPDDLLDAITELEEETNLQIFQWNDEYHDDLEINYTNFIKAYEQIKKRNLRKKLQNIYEETINSESCKKTDTIRIDWF